MSNSPTPDPKMLHVDGMAPRRFAENVAELFRSTRKRLGEFFVRRRRVPELSTLDWGRAYLSNHFAKPPPPRCTSGSASS